MPRRCPRLVTTGPDPVVHADVRPTKRRWSALYKRDICMDCRIKFGNDERKGERKKTSEAKRRQTQLVFCRALRAQPRLERQAHIYRRSTTVIVPRSLSSQGTQPQARLPGTRRDTFCASFERALPAPACPSPAKAPRAPVVVPER